MTPTVGRVVLYRDNDITHLPQAAVIVEVQAKKGPGLDGAGAILEEDRYDVWLQLLPGPTFLNVIGEADPSFGTPPIAFKHADESDDLEHPFWYWPPRV